ncbi:hypothetical protein WOSG25_012650 [Weissella oryzae SG25]|uniref:Type VII secretion protein EssA n=1 Tax=Weissella oryzae (strain DSM 25784 / JCM 18191 / LMG 30913 / SG25) TaxID=1329250 RepID=A0A069CSD3_WEIOS|nr:type VII secretion protein EssA [Weissella oryzae]GAK30168.1 hypothetical protein WOSG25_012650 [Weissella oryzae SG25]
MKKTKGVGFIVVLLLALTASPVYADNGNLELNDQALSGSDGTTKVSDQNIEYQVAPDLFMQAKTAIVKKAQRADEQTLAAAKKADFVKSKGQNDQINSNQSEKALFTSKNVNWDKSGTSQQGSAVSYGTQVFITWLTRIMLILIGLAVVVAGVFIGQKYAGQIRNLGRKKNSGELG